VTAPQQVPNEMAISESELSAMTNHLEDMHESSMSDVRASMAALTDRIVGMTGTIANRRTFLLGAGALVGTAALAACGSSSSGGTKTSSAGSASSAPTTGSSSGSSTGASPYTGDLKVVALAAALENLAVAGYGLVLSSAGKGKYGKVPPSIAQFATVVQKQHMDHAAAWNSVLTNAKLPAVKTAPLTIAKSAVASLSGAKTIPDVAKVALGIENSAAETYVFAVANVTNPGGIQVAASIAPVEAMHAAILSFVLGQYPVPNSNIGISNAVQPSALTA
jgi:Ferritin-like domain